MSQLENLAGAQRAIMPDPDALPTFKFQVHYLPMHKAGGDFYDALQAGGDIFDYIAADVSGHDADASLVTSALKVLLYQGQSTLSSPQDTLRMVNRALIASFPEAQYLTLVWVRLNRSRRTATVLSAGHPPPLHIRPSAGTVEACHLRGDVLGMFQDADLAEETFPVLPGDRLVLYTDGLIELPDGEGVSRERGLERLSRSCLEASGLALAEMVPAVVDRLISRSDPVTDDMLLMVVEV
jgi:sigma-B regulation protein RsbU (phosphoserine phosphatase)